MALETAARCQTTPRWATVSPGGQAAIRRITSEVPGPSQKSSRQARKPIAEMWRARPNSICEIWWCPAP